MWQGLLTVSLVALVGCAPKPVANTKDEIEFRLLARRLYGDLLMPSCRAPAGFDRARELNEQVGALARFEMAVSGTPAGRQLEIARKDADFSIQANGSCWEDSDIRFAKKHIDFTVGTVRYVLPQLRELAIKLPISDPNAEQPPSGSAEFRYAVRDLTASLNPICKLSTAASNEVVLAVSRSLAAELKGQLAPEWAGQFTVAEEDETSRLSQIVAECSEPSSEPPAVTTKSLLSETRQRITHLLSLTVSA